MKVGIRAAFLDHPRSLPEIAGKTIRASSFLNDGYSGYIEK